MVRCRSQAAAPVQTTTPSGSQQYPTLTQHNDFEKFLTTAMNHIILKDRDITVMGILNLTPDSYFAESRCMGADGNIDLGQVREKIRKMFADGAGIVDIGACSTRPGAELPDEDEEWRRLSVLMPVLRKEFPGGIFSVDTFRSGIVRKCFEAIGNFIVNDISAGEDDPKMLETVGKLGLTYVAMHKKGTPSDMQERCSYGDVTEDVLAYFRDFAVRADNAGITDWILDPGFGFAKTVEQNWQLMRELDRFSGQGRKVLVGISRKSMIYKALGITPEEALPQTQAAHLAALERGADILRVHDVAEAVRTVRLYRMLQ